MKPPVQTLLCLVGLVGASVGATHAAETQTAQKDSPRPPE